MTKIRALVGAAVAALLVGGTTLGVLSGSSPTTPTVFVAVNGSDTAACTASAPCKSLNRAYRAAKAGQTVEVAGGTYPQQDIAADSTKTSTDDVLFQPASGATVTMNCDPIGTVGNGSISGQNCIDFIGAKHITFDGGAGKSFKAQTYTINGFSYQGGIGIDRGSADITLRNMDIGSFFDAAPGVTVDHNDVGPSVDPLNVKVMGEAVDTVITDNLFHDFVIVNGGHFECMYWDGVQGVTLAYNEFRSCAVYGIHSKEGGTFSSRGVTVDHNVFWNPRNLTTQEDVQLTTEALPCSDSTVTNNVFTDGLINECTPTTESGNTFRSQNDPPPASPIRGDVTPPPPVTTTAPTTTVVPPPPPPAYHPACEPTCDADLAAANDKVSALEAKIAAAAAALR